ncbi:MAG: hypothetical protein R2795_19575 [Saprospiraceae bacterium]
MLASAAVRICYRCGYTPGAKFVRVEALYSDVAPVEDVWQYAAAYRHRDAAAVRAIARIINIRTAWVERDRAFFSYRIARDLRSRSHLLPLLGTHRGLSSSAVDDPTPMSPQL